MKGSERTAEAVRRTVGSGQARMYRDLATVLSESPDNDRPALRVIVLDALCGEFDPFRAADGAPVAALLAAIAAAEVTLPTRVLLETVAAQLAAGDYAAPDDAELWVARLCARHRSPPRRVVPRPVRALPRYAGEMTQWLSTVYEAARIAIERGEPPTRGELAAALGRDPGAVRAALSHLLALGALVDVGGTRGLELGERDAR